MTKTATMRSAILVGGLLALTATTAAFAETTANNSGKQLENFRHVPQGGSGAGYFVAASGTEAVAKPAKPKARSRAR